MTQLYNSGLYVTHARELFGEAEFALLLSQTRRWLESDTLKAEVAKFRAGTREAGLKPFVVKYNENRAYPKDDALIAIANAPKVKAIVEDAIGPAKLICVDMWHNPAGCNQREKVWSQSWHRDPEDASPIKVFIYLSDVDADSGPFEYVLGSHLNEFDKCPPGLYPEKSIDTTSIWPQRFIRVTGKTGTVAFCNTSGLHQGGHGAKPRTMAVLTFVPEQSQHPTIFSVRG